MAAPAAPAPERWRPPLLSWVLRTLREGLGWTQADLAAAAGTTPQVISRFESGRVLTLSREKLEEFAGLMDYEPAAVEEMIFSLAEARPPYPQQPWSPVGPSELVQSHIRRTVRANGFAAIAETEDLAIRRFWSRRARRDRERAARFWSKHLLPCPADERGLLIEVSPSYRTWALAELLAHESAKAACQDAKAALDLAELALRVAEEATAKDPEPWRFFLLGYVWLFVANARRVSADLDAAEEASAKGRALWEAGEDAARLLAKWRVPDLTASLRRDQRRFAEAQALHERAEALAPEAERGRIFLSKAATFEQMTDYEGALEALREAEPRIDAGSEVGLRYGLRLSTAVVLLHLGRVAEVPNLVTELGDLATRMSSRPHAVRVRWLEGRLAHELGKLAEAQAAFEHARRAFEDLALPCDFALATLDLALLHRGQGRWREVRSLAADIVRVFEQRHVHREALAAALLFEEAATNEAVTEDLVRRLQNYLTAAQRNPRLRFEP